MYGATAGTAYPYQNSYPANTPASASTQQNHKITTGLGASSSKDSQVGFLFLFLCILMYRKHKLLIVKDVYAVYNTRCNMIIIQTEEK